MSFRLTILLTALLTTLSLSLSTPFDASSRRDPIFNRGLATSDFDREVAMRGLLPSSDTGLWALLGLFSVFVFLDFSGLLCVVCLVQ